MSHPNFDALHQAMQHQVEQEFLPGVATAVIQGKDVVDQFCFGYADREASIRLQEDHLFRVFSNTKLVTTCAVMMLFEEGRFRWDDPIEVYLPELGSRQVLKAGARRIDEVVPARRSITIRDLMVHTSGLSYGLFDPGTPLFIAYGKAGVMHPGKTLSDMITALSPLPLAFHPGTKWEYSVATDVLARLVEVISGSSFGRFLSNRIFEPLAMTDTDFYVPEHKISRLCALYMGVDPHDSTKPGLLRADSKPYPEAYRRRVARESGGGGLISTLGDTVKLVQSFLPGGPTLLRTDSLDLMFRNQLPVGLCVQFPGQPRFEHMGFAFGSSVAIGQGASDPADVVGEVGWGGLAGTSWWINPRLGIAGVLMTQRYFASWDRYSFEFKREAYKALGFL